MLTFRPAEISIVWRGSDSITGQGTLVDDLMMLLVTPRSTSASKYAQFTQGASSFRICP